VIGYSAAYLMGAGATGDVTATLGDTNVMSADDAADKAVEYINDNIPGVTASLNSVVEENGMYTVDLILSQDGQSQNIEVWVTKDGGKMFPPQQPIDLDEAVEPTVNPMEISWENVFVDMGLDADRINSCMSDKGAALLGADAAVVSANDIFGSPNMLINGESLGSLRDAATYKAAICSAFTTKPAICSDAAATDFDAPNSAVPEVELYVMSFCPFGMDAEAVTKPVIELFGDSIKFRPRFILTPSVGDRCDYGNPADGFCSLHGEYETIEDERQLCVIDEYGMDAWWDYVIGLRAAIKGESSTSSSGSC
jgi:hypothetical protein